VGCTPVSTLLPVFKEKITLHDNLDKQLNTDTQPEHVLHTESKMTSQPVKVGPVDQEAQRNLQLLHLQAITRKDAKKALSDISQNEPLIDDLLKLIKKYQEDDPYYKRVAKQALYQCQQLSDAPIDRSTIVPEVHRPTLGKVEDSLLYEAGHVIVPEQTTLQHKLLQRFYDCPSSGHWDEKCTKEILQ
jgi:hypothetical protein